MQATRNVHREGAQQVFTVLRVELWPALPQCYPILREPNRNRQNNKAARVSGKLFGIIKWQGIGFHFVHNSSKSVGWL